MYGAGRSAIMLMINSSIMQVIVTGRNDLNLDILDESHICTGL